MTQVLIIVAPTDVDISEFNPIATGESGLSNPDIVILLDNSCANGRIFRDHLGNGVGSVDIRPSNA